MKKVWKSNDGKIFDSWDECHEYENRSGKKLKSNNTLNLGSRNFNRKTNLKQFYKVEELRIKLREKNEERSQAFQWLAIKQKAAITGDPDLLIYLKQYVKENYSVDVDTTPLLTEDEELFYLKEIQKFNEFEREAFAYVEKLEEANERIWKRVKNMYWSPPAKSVGYLSEYERWDRWYKENGIDEDDVSEKEEKKENAVEKIAISYFRLVIHVVLKNANENSNLYQLMEIGRIRLIKAIEKFDLASGYKFSTYAYWWIKSGIDAANEEQLEEQLEEQKMS